jgi:hypothetical protein
MEAWTGEEISGAPWRVDLQTTGAAIRGSVASGGRGEAEAIGAAEGWRTGDSEAPFAARIFPRMPCLEGMLGARLVPPSTVTEPMFCRYMENEPPLPRWSPTVNDVAASSYWRNSIQTFEWESPIVTLLSTPMGPFI